MFRIYTASSDDKKEWNSIVLGSVDGKLCHMFEWNEILPKVYDYKPTYLSIRENQELVGVFPSFIIKSRLFGSRLVSMPFDSYGGPLFKRFSRTMNRELLATVASISRSENLEYAEIRSPSLYSTDTIKEEGFIENTNYSYFTFLIDLKQDIKKILMSLRKSTRRGIRIAERKGINIKEAKTDGDLKNFYNLYLTTMKKHGSPPHSFSFFKELWDHFYPSYLRIFFANYQDRNISAMLFYVFNKEIHYGYGASLRDEKYLRLCPNDLLVWYAIGFGKERDLTFLNLGRTRPNSNVYFFKLGWDGKKVPLTYFCKLTNADKLPFLDPYSYKYRVLTQIWKTLPDSIATNLGPRLMGGTGG